jgi:diphthamide biosynthesis methyltransferase
MPAIKMNLSLDPHVAELLRQRAEEQAVPASQYVAELVKADARRHRDELAAEGYRVLGAEARGFAAAALPLAAEIWPTWEEADANQTG